MGERVNFHNPPAKKKTQKASKSFSFSKKNTQIHFQNHCKYDWSEIHTQNKIKKRFLSISLTTKQLGPPAKIRYTVAQITHFNEKYGHLCIGTNCGWSNALENGKLPATSQKKIQLFLSGRIQHGIIPGRFFQSRTALFDGSKKSIH